MLEGEKNNRAGPGELCFVFPMVRIIYIPTQTISPLWSSQTIYATNYKGNSSYYNHFPKHTHTQNVIWGGVRGNATSAARQTIFNGQQHQTTPPTLVIPTGKVRLASKKPQRLSLLNQRRQGTSNPIFFCVCV